MKKHKSKHGGARKGAGRKKGFRMKKSEKKEPTVVMRIPVSKVAAVKKLIKGVNPTNEYENRNST